MRFFVALLALSALLLLSGCNLPPGNEILVSVKATDSNSAPLLAVGIALVPENENVPSRVQYTDQDGITVFEIEGGTYRLTATKTGYLTVVRDVNFNEQQDYEIALDRIK